MSTLICFCEMLALVGTRSRPLLLGTRNLVSPTKATCEREWDKEDTALPCPVQPHCICASGLGTLGIQRVVLGDTGWYWSPLTCFPNPLRMACPYDVHVLLMREEHSVLAMWASCVFHLIITVCKFLWFLLKLVLKIALSFPSLKPLFRAIFLFFTLKLVLHEGAGRNVVTSVSYPHSPTCWL